MQILKKNDELILTIEDLGANGEGIAHFNGATVFVLQALVGEEVLAHIISCKKSFYVAKIVKILKASTIRIPAPCPYYGKCGGCDLQHMNYKIEKEFKSKLVKVAIKKYAGIDIEVLPTISSDKEFRYRNKFAFPVVENNGEVVIGMYRKNSHEVIGLSDCMLQTTLASKLINIFKEYMALNNISAYNEQTKSGDIKHLVVREHNNKFILTVVVANEKFDNFDPLIKLLNAYNFEYGLYKNINTLNNNVIFGTEDKYVYGFKELNIKEFDIDYKINNRSFMQVNDEIKLNIYQKITQEINAEDIVVDAYSGAGLLSAIIAKKAQKVYGIEIVKEATKDAEFLKKYNNLNNLININGDTNDVLPKLAKTLPKDFVLVLDPPRKGVDNNVLNLVLKLCPKKIIYLSCNPATLARDLAILSQSYIIKQVQPYNMFPKTANVETLVILDKKG